MAGLVAQRYGAAIFELAKEKDAVIDMETEIIAVSESFKDLGLEEFLGHPKVSMAEKIKVLESSLTGKVSHDLLGLLVLVVRKGRYYYVDEIFEEALDLIDAYRGRVKAYIGSADELTVDQKSKIVHQLAAESHKTIIPIYEVDPSLIGGLVLRIGDRIVDNSIKGHMHSMSRKMLATKID